MKLYTIIDKTGRILGWTDDDVLQVPRAPKHVRLPILKPAPISVEEGIKAIDKRQSGVELLWEEMKLRGGGAPASLWFLVASEDMPADVWEGEGFIKANWQT